MSTQTKPIYIEPPSWRRVILTFIVLTLALAPIPFLLNHIQRQTRGVVYGVPPRMPHTHVQPYAVNVDLRPLSPPERDRALTRVVQGGFGWVRIRFPWFDIETEAGKYHWTPYDQIVQAVHEQGLGIIALIDGTPSWLRPPGEKDNPVVPPADLDLFARFAATLARRYGDRIDYYQVWDQPNVTPFWGNKRVDPAGYVQMLRRVGQAIREADESAYILSAGLAPTTLHKPYNMSDIDYLDAMYRAGAKGTFDILGAKAYDLYQNSPWSRDYSPDHLGITRLVLLREVMIRHHDGNTPIWVVGWGRHATPPHWKGRPSIWGTVSEEEQAQYVKDVYRRKRQEWPWLGLLTWDQFYPNVPPDDPLWGFALLRPNWQPRPVYRAFQELTAPPPLIGVGRYGPNTWIWRYPDAQFRHTIRAEGNRISIIARALVAVEASLDGEERSILLDANREHVLGDHLPLQPHTLVFRFDPAGVTTLLIGRNRPLGPYIVLGILAMLAVGALILLGLWATWAPTEPVVYPVLIAILTVFYMMAPTLWTSLITLMLLAGLIFYRPDWGLVAALGVTPFVAVPKRLGHVQFSLVETYIILVTLAWTLRLAGEMIIIVVEAPNVPWRLRLYRATRVLVNRAGPRNALDVMVLLFVPLGVWAAWGARYQDVAWREIRWVVLEPVLFYGILRSRWRDHIHIARKHIPQRARSWLYRHRVLMTTESDIPQFGAYLVNGFLWGSSLAVLIGIALLFYHPEGAYAEGVWRLRGLYGSPNNLALILGRAFAIAAALALFLPFDQPSRGRGPSVEERTWPRVLPGLRPRQGYAVLAGWIFLGIMGTFSRGALLVGLPVTLLFLGWMHGKRGRMYALVAILLLASLQIPLLTTPRFRTLVTGTGTPALRVELWRSSLQMIKDHWWRGVGPDNFLYYFRTQYLPRRNFPEPNLSHPHNILLHFWLEFGFGGILWLGATLWLFFHKVQETLRVLPTPSMSRALVLAAAGGILYGISHGLVDQSFLLPDLMLLFVWHLGMVASIEERRL